jgi:hypothetical protein
MIRRWLERRRRQRACLHPRADQNEWLIDTGMRKLFECRLCGKREVV